MAFSYTNLRSLILSTIHRPELTDEVTEWIQMAEDRIDTDVRDSIQEVTSVLNTLSTISPTPLPFLFSEIVELSFLGGTRRTVLKSVPRQSLPLWQSSAGDPQVYSIIRRTIEIQPNPGDRAFRLIYFARPAILDFVNNGNPLLDEHPTLYFYAGMVEAARWLQDPELFNSSEADYQKVVVRINIESDNAIAGSYPQVRAVP